MIGGGVLVLPPSAGLQAVAVAVHLEDVRLLAEQAGAAAPAFPDELMRAAASDPALAGLLQGEIDRLATRRAALHDQQAVLGERIAQADVEIGGLQAQIASADRQLELIGEEVAAVEDLLRKGLERKPRLLALQRAQADIDGTIGSDRASIARAG